ncbi:MAG TPA: glutamate-cysteine ligase family protein [Nocardioidaceae bacterium]|nr:glutamate-cysteine ligase family protein [Nocardioidaceae bacterium]
MTQATVSTRRIPRTEDAEAYVAMVCFKHGPPERTGVELEWTVHHQGAQDRPLDPRRLASALGDHAPPSISPTSTHTPLPRGSLVTVEPGGQVEISSLPSPSLADLVGAVESDLSALDALLETRELRRGSTGIDPHRPPSRLLDVPRYAAMQEFFDGRGPWGSAMMCSTASTQVCLDAGEPSDVPLRWRALHSVGPTLVALFANSPVVRGVRTGWASNRLRATLGTCPPVTHPLDIDRDPVTSWVDRVMSAPVMCVRRAHGHWAPDRSMSFAGWVSGAGETAPTFDDLDYHLSTLFPPVRPRGYVEVRYLDTQPDCRWHHPLLLLTALLSSRAVTDRACELTEECSGLWLTAARTGLQDRSLRRAARALVDLAASHLDPALDSDLTDEVVETLQRRTAHDAPGRPA